MKDSQGYTKKLKKKKKKKPQNFFFLVLRIALFGYYRDG